MEIYRKKNLENIFSGMIQLYMIKGYRINATTMGGSQGEIAKIDLTNDEEIVRVSMDRTFYSDRDAFYHGDSITITAERYPMSDTDLLWTGKGEEIEKREYVLLEGEAYCMRGKFVSAADFKTNRIAEKKKDRVQFKGTGIINFDMDVVLGIVRKQPGLKTATPENIVRVRKDNGQYSIGLIGRSHNYVYVTADGTRVQ